jgi:hypothetical protein
VGGLKDRQGKRALTWQCTWQHQPSGERCCRLQTREIIIGVHQSDIPEAYETPVLGEVRAMAVRPSRSSEPWYHVSPPSSERRNQAAGIEPEGKVSRNTTPTSRHTDDGSGSPDVGRVGETDVHERESVSAVLGHEELLVPGDTAWE